jgi:hypothetical protein
VNDPSALINIIRIEFNGGIGSLNSDTRDFI